MQTKLVLKQRSALKLRFQPGATGPSGTVSVGTVSTGAAGSNVVITNTGTPNAAILNFTIPEGDQGVQGDTGNKGWSPAFAIVSDGARRVLQVDDWVGGEGTKPATGDYVGAFGLTPTIGDAIDIRGPDGGAIAPEDYASQEEAEAGADNEKLMTPLRDAQAAAAYVIPTRAVTITKSIPAAIMAIRTTGYSAPGDGGGALYKRAGSEPSHTGKFQSVDGAWWEIAELTLDPRMFGAVGNDSTDDTTSLQNAITASGALRRPLNLGPGSLTYKITTSLSIPDYAYVKAQRLFGAKVHYTALTGNAIVIEGSYWTLSFELYSDGLRTITGITKANPAVVTCPGHGFSTGNQIMIRQVEGMTELNYRRCTVTVLNANTFSLDSTNSTGFTTYTGGGHAMRYVNGHRGIFGQRTTFSPTNVVWIDSPDISGMHVHGFSDVGIRLDWVRDMQQDDLHLHHCGYGGLIGSSVIKSIGDGIQDLHDFGPGSSGTSYPMSFSRVYSSPALGIADAPPSTDIHLDVVYSRNNPYYFAFDVHGAQGVSINLLKSRNCHGGINFEHATGGGDNVSVNGFTLGAYDLEGVDPTRHDIGPAFYVDAQSGAGELSKGISIGKGRIVRHGHKNDFGNAVASEGAVFYLNNAVGITIGDVQMIDCYKRGVRFVGTVKAATIGDISCLDMVTVTTAYLFEITSGAATVSAVIGNIAMSGAAGSVFNTSTFAAGYGLVVGNVATDGGVTLMTAAAKGQIKWGSAITAARVMVQWDSSGTIVWDGFQELGASVSVAKNGTGDFTVTMPSGMFNNARVAALAGADGARDTEITSSSNTSVQVRTYNSSAALTDYPDNWLLVWGR